MWNTVFNNKKRCKCAERFCDLFLCLGNGEPLSPFEGNLGIVGLQAIPELGQIFGEVGLGRRVAKKYYVDHNGEVLGHGLDPVNDIFYSGPGRDDFCRTYIRAAGTRVWICIHLIGVRIRTQGLK